MKATWKKYLFLTLIIFSMSTLGACEFFDRELFDFDQASDEDPLGDGPDFSDSVPVGQYNISDITIEQPQIQIAVGQTAQPNLVVSYEHGALFHNVTNTFESTYDSSTYDVTWESEDESIATVDEYGVVTAIGVGTTNVTSTLDSFSDSFEVVVSSASIPMEDLVLSNMTFYQNFSQFSSSATFDMTVNAHYEGGLLQQDLTSEEFFANTGCSLVFSSSNTAVATIDSFGTITALNNGSTIFTVSIDSCDGDTAYSYSDTLEVVITLTP